MDLLAETDARAALDALPGLTWAPLDSSDLPDAAALYAACDAHDRNSERTVLADLEEYWNSARSVPEQDTLLARDSAGRPVALAWSGCNRAVTSERRARLNGCVLPSRRRQGIGSAVLRWELAHAREWDAASRRDDHGPLVVRVFGPSEQEDLARLMQNHGLVVERYFYEMCRRFDAAEPVVTAPPTGIRITDWDPARSNEVNTVLNETFAEHWGHVDTDDQAWQEEMAEHSFRPQWTVLAVDTATDELVGVAKNAAYEQDWPVQGFSEGYTDALGVRKTYRGRGIASALLTASMQRFAQAGLDAAGLSVDTANATGALRLYESLGYRPVARTCAYRLADA